MAISPYAPSLSDSPSAADTTMTNLILFQILQALDSTGANQLPDDAVTAIVGNETL